MPLENSDNLEIERPSTNLFQILWKNKGSAVLLGATLLLSGACAWHGKDGPAVVSFMTGAYFLKSLIDRARTDAFIHELKKVHHSVSPE